MQLTRRNHSLVDSEAVYRAGSPTSNLFTGQLLMMCAMHGLSEAPFMESGYTLTCARSGFQAGQIEARNDSGVAVGSSIIEEFTGKWE